MSSASAIPDSNPTRAQLRLAVLAGWVRTGLELARGARAGRGLLGGAVALWQVFQAIRLAMLLARRLSELQEVLSRATPPTRSGEAPALEASPFDDPSTAAAAVLRPALTELLARIRDALGLGASPRLRSDTDRATGGAARPELAYADDRPRPPRGLPPDRPPGRERWRARRRSPRAIGALETAPTPIATLASGRVRLSAA